MTSYTIACATNDKAVLESNLLVSSLGLLSAKFAIVSGSASASHAYQSVLGSSNSDIVIFAHQDVFLPDEWLVTLDLWLQRLEAIDPNWGVVGTYGVTHSGERVGFIYSSGLQSILGSDFNLPIRVRTLDEVILIVRRESCLGFDPTLPGFHMYGTDICLEAERRGLSNYIVPCFAIHNSNGIRQLPYSFWQACRFIRNKWRDRLPIVSPCTVVSRYPVSTAKQMLQRFVLFYLKGKAPGRRVADPSKLYLQLKPSLR